MDSAVIVVAFVAGLAIGACVMSQFDVALARVARSSQKAKETR